MRVGHTRPAGSTWRMRLHSWPEGDPAPAAPPTRDRRAQADFNDRPDSLRIQDDSLREAALSAYGRCGQEVTHFVTEPRTV